MGATSIGISTVWLTRRRGSMLLPPLQHRQPRFQFCDFQSTAVAVHQPHDLRPLCWGKVTHRHRFQHGPSGLCSVTGGSHAG